MKLYIFIFFIVFFGLLCAESKAQSQDTIAKQKVQAVPGSDSSKFFKIDKVLKDEPVKVKKFHMQKSPTRALVYSLLMPGLGQVYVGSYWKAPLFLAGAGTLGYLIITNNKKYSDNQNKYDIMKKNNPDNVYSLDSLRIEKEYYRDSRDMSAFYFLAVYLVSAIDAYTGAHLFDFNVSDDLSVGLKSDEMNYARLYLKYKW